MSMITTKLTVSSTDGDRNFIQRSSNVGLPNIHGHWTWNLLDDVGNRCTAKRSASFDVRSTLAAVLYSLHEPGAKPHT